MNNIPFKQFLLKYNFYENNENLLGEDNDTQIIRIKPNDILESNDNLKGTKFLDAFCILQWIDTTRKENEALKQTHDYDLKMIDEVKSSSAKVLQENRQLKEQLKQRDEVINEVINLNCKVIKMINEGYSHEQYSEYIKKVLDILQKYRGNNND